MWLEFGFDKTQHSYMNSGIINLLYVRTLKWSMSIINDDDYPTPILSVSIELIYSDSGCDIVYQYYEPFRSSKLNPVLPQICQIVYYQLKLAILTGTDWNTPGSLNYIKCYK
ncbi:hypothetical protein YTPLAS21_19210 [Candidatus Nitrosocosmicus sp.]|nr:hypothetical protein YTPLAS21_19210 [Candidatus Nitrosocosmicus sp.]